MQTSVLSMLTIRKSRPSFASLPEHVLFRISIPVTPSHTSKRLFGQPPVQQPRDIHHITRLPIEGSEEVKRQPVQTGLQVIQRHENVLFKKAAGQQI
eukprot:2092306-Amphidinium_carterae.2